MDSSKKRFLSLLAFTGIALFHSLLLLLKVSELPLFLTGILLLATGTHFMWSISARYWRTQPKSPYRNGKYILPFSLISLFFFIVFLIPSSFAFVPIALLFPAISLIGLPIILNPQSKFSNHPLSHPFIQGIWVVALAAGILGSAQSGWIGLRIMGVSIEQVPALHSFLAVIMGIMAIVGFFALKATPKKRKIISSNSAKMMELKEVYQSPLRSEIQMENYARALNRKPMGAKLTEGKLKFEAARIHAAHHTPQYQSYYEQLGQAMSPILSPERWSSLSLVAPNICLDCLQSGHTQRVYGIPVSICPKCEDYSHLVWEYEKIILHPNLSGPEALSPTIWAIPAFHQMGGAPKMGKINELQLPANAGFKGDYWIYEWLREMKDGNANCPARLQIVLGKGVQLSNLCQTLIAQLDGRVTVFEADNSLDSPIIYSQTLTANQTALA